MASTSTPAALTDRTSDETRAFFQARMTKYLLIYGCVGGSFLGLRCIGQLASGSDDALDHPSFVSHAIGVAFSLGGWLFLRRGKIAVDALERVETAALLASMSAYALMGYFLPLAGSAQLTVMLALAMGLFARAIYVPSTARRSLVLALAIALPHLALAAHAPFRELGRLVDVEANDRFLRAMASYYGVALEQLRWSVSMGTAVNLALWWVGTIVLTTGASRTIYDLREEVRDVKRLGQYHLEEKLGEGGMGIVYRASHAMLQRPTAVKLLPTDRVGEHSLARFEREVRMTARLTHPNTVTIFDYGRTPDGVFYYAMELLEGATLAELVENHGPLAPSRAVHILRQICGSLREAHRVGLIHRDIKPANIMLCERGGVYDTVKVLDFGLVKELKKSDGAPLTRTDMVTGTPQYIPPEALTAPDRVDARSDLYSLGAVAFWMLTGEELFGGATLIEVCSHHLHTPPRRPSEVEPGVPEDLERAVLACLAKDPSARPESAEALERALAACACAADWSEADAAAWWKDRTARESAPHAR